ncbi:MAG: ABC transporter substrate-binding protein [Nocardioidaceae bacterium]
MSDQRFASRPAAVAGSAGLSRRSLLRGAAGALALPALGGSAATLLAGCGGSGGGSSKQLTFWNFYAPADDGNPQSQWFVDLVKKWNTDNEVQIKLRYLPVSDYLAGTSLQTAFQSGDGPDIFLISPGDFLRYYNGGVLADLTPYLSKEAQADFLPGVLDTRMVEDKIFGLPMEVEPLGLYYSPAAFESVGLSEADVPTTWDQLLDVADKLTNEKRYGVLFETISGYYQNFTWYPFMWMGGGNAVENGRSAFDSPATEQALKLWQDTIRTGVAPRKPQGDGAGNASANLASGYCAIQQTGTWAVADLELNKKSFEYGVAPLPVPSGGTYTTDMGGWAFVANAKGANPEAAAKFVAWALGSTEADGIERCRQWNSVVKTTVPTRKSVKEAAISEGAYAEGAMATFIDEIAPGGRSEPRYPPEIYQAVSDALQACQLDGTDPQQAAAEASSTISTYLESYQGAPVV